MEIIRWSARASSGEAIPAFVEVAAGVERVIKGDIDGIDESGAGELAGAAGGEVVGIRGNPEGVEAVAGGEGGEELEGSGGVVVTAKRGFDGVSDVAPEEDGVGVVGEAESDVSHGGAGFGVDHEKAIKGDGDTAAVSGEGSGEDEGEVAIAEIAGIEEGWSEGPDRE